MAANVYQVTYVTGDEGSLESVPALVFSHSEPQAGQTLPGVWVLEGGGIKFEDKAGAGIPHGSHDQGVTWY